MSTGGRCSDPQSPHVGTPCLCHFLKLQCAAVRNYIFNLRVRQGTFYMDFLFADDSLMDEQTQQCRAVLHSPTPKHFFKSNHKPKTQESLCGGGPVPSEEPEAPQQQTGNLVTTAHLDKTSGDPP
ncbi:unnamed protein product [Pleuronectes platessa]|uniref:Uncharacterized protein n=1 Tax=Pleuronectes platessa TaxID=8262 RepID=A0A9N7TND0_PLEPL|nr:unnamed protein product [Pleuronectes platessa]